MSTRLTRGIRSMNTLKSEVFPTWISVFCEILLSIITSRRLWVGINYQKCRYQAHQRIWQSSIAVGFSILLWFCCSTETFVSGIARLTSNKCRRTNLLCGTGTHVQQLISWTKMPSKISSITASISHKTQRHTLFTRTIPRKQNLESWWRYEIANKTWG